MIQNDVANRHSPITIVAAITSKVGEKVYPTEVPVGAPEGGLSTDSVVLLNQVRSVDRRRLSKRLGAMRRETMKKVGRSLMISLGIVEL